MSINAIRKLTVYFDEADWQIVGEYLKTMNELPGAAAEVRRKARRARWLRRQDHQSRLYRAIVLLHEQYELWEAKSGR